MSFWDELSRPQRAGLITAGLIATLGVGYWLGAARTPPIAPKESVGPPVSKPLEPVPVADITVFVSGAVKNPGLVQTKKGARSIDAIQAAGGFTDDADTQSLNLAKILKDGDEVKVGFLKGEFNPGAQMYPVNVNTASITELQTLPGIGPALAERIVRHRDERGPFSVPEDLLEVEGINRGNVDELRPFISF